MNRITNDNPKGIREKINNLCTKDNENYVVLRNANGKENVRLHEYTAECCRKNGCKDMTACKVLSSGLLGCCNCHIAIMYFLGLQAEICNAKLKKYEDTGLEPNEIKKLKQENDKLKGLLKLSASSIKSMADTVRETHEDDCICGYCQFNCDTTVGESGEPYGECPGCDSNECFRWKHASEVEEVLKDE